MASKSGRKSLGTRGASATPRDATSLTANTNVTDSKKPKIVIWPEWNDNDVNAEKWEASKRDDKKGKSPIVQYASLYEDPDGRLELPPSLKVEYWKRPGDLINDKIPVVVDTENIPNGIDLISNNEHLHQSELLRYCISQIMILWDMHAKELPADSITEAILPGDDPTHMWRPWDHIYSLCKAAKGPHLPLYNNYGKYIVKLFWMGAWRKIYVDDLLPFDEHNKMLLPSSAVQHELWPMLLTKALIKVASLDYAGGNPSQEFGDMTVIHCLTGWIPEIIPLQFSHVNEVWDLVKSSLPEWKLPIQEWEKKREATEVHAPLKEEKLDKDSSMREQRDLKLEKGKGKGKEEKRKDKKEDKPSKVKEKERLQSSNSHAHEEKAVEEFVMPEKPETIMFATYNSTPKYPVKVSVLGEMADASEILRQNGLSHMCPHPVYLSQTRCCPLEPPPPPIVIPTWKLIRPRKKKLPPHDEPVPDPEPPKDIKCLEIISPFVNYKVCHIPIPTDTHRPKSALERGGGRSRMEEQPIDEVDENPPTPPPIPTSTTESEELLKEGGEASKLQTVKRRQSLKKIKPGSASKEGAPPKLENKSLKPEEGKEILAKDGPSIQSVIELASGASSAMPAEMPAVPLEEPPKESIVKKVWMDYDTFYKCFRTLYIFHKPNTYPCNQRHSDFKTPYAVEQHVEKPASSSHKSAKGHLREDTLIPTATASSKGDKKQSQMPATLADSSSSYYLFVDNLKQTEILVSLTVLPRWFDGPVHPNPNEEKKLSLTPAKHGKDKDIEKLEKEMTNASLNLGEHIVAETKPPPPVTPGSLVAEPYSWKSLVTGQPILRLRTTGTKAALLTLPPGRHVLRLMMSSPLGHYVHMCSATNFVFGDEETVMPLLTNESCRFRDNALAVIQCLGKCIQAFSEPERFKQEWDGLVEAHCPYLANRQMSKVQHYQIFNESLYVLLRKVLKDVINPDVVFAWRSFLFDTVTPNILNIPVPSRPGITNEMCRCVYYINLLYTNSFTEHEKIDFPWMGRQPTIEEQIATVKIQKTWRGFFTRKLQSARKADTPDNAKVSEILSKCWSYIEANAEENGLFLLREMFRKNSDMIPLYPFYQDEWNKISYADYKGTYYEQPSMNWFIVFRDIFYVKEEMLVVPKLYVPINTCMLRVINNDTYEEIPRVFQKVAPYVYKKNKKGYSFVAEARTVEQPLTSGNWRMRLIGSLSPLPAPQTAEVCSSFITKEIKEYYIPNPNNLIFRQSVKVAEDHFASLQVNTSKRDVYIKLSILDNDEEIISAVGKGHVVIPAFIFLKNITQDDIDRRSGSRASMKGSVAAVSNKSDKVSTKTKRSESVVNEQAPPSRSSMRSEAELAERLEDTKPHKYVIQAKVLQNSWPLSEKSWRHVMMLKEIEKNELKVANKERDPSPPKVEKTPATNKGKPKVGKDKGVKEKGQEVKVSRPPSQNFDLTKPHYVLRVVSDSFAAEEIEIKKDTERADEIRALKKAWEEAEPGRAAKALQARLMYLNTHAIKLAPTMSDITVPTPKSDFDTFVHAAESGSVINEQDSMPPQSPDHVESDVILTLEPPHPAHAKEIVEPLDLTPFIRKTLPEPIYLDEEEKQKLLEKRQQEIADYKAFREKVEQWREMDKQNRNKAKIQQLKQYQALQAALDAARERINIPREAIRQKYLEAERLRLEELERQAALLKAEQGSAVTKGKKPPKKK
ncbi:unnamed protein product [Lymnaea stagnalis]|uniref:Androglobin n=1 Tax=Lymnaea stagnalis TaxID=6523 RepID=A0AAV2IQE4_LYMST